MTTLDTSDVYDALRATVDPRTLAVLEHRRRTSVIKRRGWLIRRALLAADLIGLSLAFAVAEVFFAGRRAGGLSPGAEYLAFIASLPVWVVTAKVYGLYARDEERADHSTIDDVVGVFHLVTVCTWLLYLGSYVTALAQPELPKLAVFWCLAVVAVPMLRGGARSYCRTRINYLQNTLIVGADEVAQLVARKVLKHPEYGINVVGFVDTGEARVDPELGHMAVIGDLDDVPRLVRLLDVERIIVAFSAENHEHVLTLVRSLNGFDLQVDIVPRLYEVVGPSVDVHSVEGLPLVGLRPPKLSRSSALLKRTLDLAGALLGLLLLAPFGLLAAIAIKLDSRGRVFFAQERMGAGGETFQILKFRTMVADADARKSEYAHLCASVPDGRPAMFKIENDPRVTRVGRVLRRFSLDELPQLWNVVRGEMSLVGPRPLILDEDAHVDDWARKRLDLKPGMTGLWQVLGSSAIPFEEMVRLDYIYVTGWSLWSDFRLLLQTVPLVVLGRRKGL